MLHIFGKVKSQGSVPNIPTAEPEDLGDFGDPDPEPNTEGGSGEL